MKRDVKININIHTLLNAMCGEDRKGITYMHLSLLTACLSIVNLCRESSHHKSHKVEVGIFDLRSDVVRVEGFISSQIILISAFEGKMYR